MADQSIYRVMDANFNRAKEGLRVCEDICRFIDDDASGSRKYKDIRHDLTAAVQGLNFGRLIAARDIAGDVGRGSTQAEFCRADVGDIFFANSQRVKESIRVLEEFSKLLDAGTAQKLKKIRYDIYHLEKQRVRALLRRKGRRGHE